ncbi:hypothetical protein OBBRIDRAFT_804431 [Obba rivulosa]|uniref:Uncharacterized protein n=1 Tax=Obba rivulosa TaxID=1052685 RepID=A0A8E2ARW6_9APHY|nr:hypothetical protein OBBRIDRAFT_804431 [Obba rivulosa]
MQMKWLNSGIISAAEIVYYILFRDLIVLQIQEGLAAGVKLAQTDRIGRLIKRYMKALRDEFELEETSLDAEAASAEIREWQEATSDLNKGQEPSVTKKDMTKWQEIGQRFGDTRVGLYLHGDSRRCVERDAETAPEHY